MDLLPFSYAAGITALGTTDVSASAFVPNKPGIRSGNMRGSSQTLMVSGHFVFAGRKWSFYLAISL
jgi:hypothetical protein